MGGAAAPLVLIVRDGGAMESGRGFRAPCLGIWSRLAFRAYDGEAPPSRSGKENDDGRA